MIYKFIVDGVDQGKFSLEDCRSMAAKYPGATICRNYCQQYYSVFTY